MYQKYILYKAGIIFYTKIFFLINTDSILPPQCTHVNTTGWYAAITLTTSTLMCT